MKILFLTSQYSNIYNLQLGAFNVPRVKALERIGYKIKVIAPIGVTPPERLLFPVPKILKIIKSILKKISIPKKEIIEGNEVYHPKWVFLPKIFFWYYESILLNLFAGGKIRTIIKEFKPDIILTSWLNPDSYFTKFIKKYYECPIISILEGSDVLFYSKKYKGGQRILEDLSRNVDKVVFVSNRMKLDSESISKVENSLVIKNGYRTDLFYYDNKSEKKTYQTRLISVGSLSPVKGHDILLNAINNLGASYHLTLLGDGFLRQHYEDFVLKKDLTDIVDFIGNVPVSRVKYYLDKSNIFCMPSRSESFGISALEAMACGIPVVATRVGGLPEIIVEGFNGYLCEPEDPESLAEAIIKAKNTNWNRKAIANWVRDNFSWDKWAKKMNNVIKQVTK